MTMEINDLIMLIGAMGGLEGAKWIVRSIRHWRSDRRKEDAAADSLVDENHRRRIDWRKRTRKSTRSMTNCGRSRAARSSSSQTATNASSKPCAAR